MWLLTNFLAMLWNALYWKTLSEISKTAGTLDLVSVWEDELNDPVDFFADGFLSCFVCPGFSQLRFFCKKLCYATFSWSKLEIK